MTARRAPLLAALLCALAGAVPAPVSAEEVTGEQLSALASRARDDRGALERLRRVDRVDGRAADVAGGLRGAHGADLRARLEALAAVEVRDAPQDAAAARARARALLADGKYTGTQVGTPFRDALDRIGREARELFASLDGSLPGGGWVVWVVLALLVGVLSWVLAGRTVRRAALSAGAWGGGGGAPRPESPAELERRAAEAERRGDHEAALRLRFRAGLLRLDARGTIEFRPSLPTGEVARVLHSSDFDGLAARFDEVVYGRRPATAEDAEASRRGWAAVLGRRR